MLLGMLSTWPLALRRRSGGRLAEPHSLICTRGFAPKVSFLLLLLQCLFFQLADELFRVHLKERDRVLKQGRAQTTQRSEPEQQEGVKYNSEPMLQEC